MADPIKVTLENSERIGRCSHCQGATNWTVLLVVFRHLELRLCKPCATEAANGMIGYLTQLAKRLQLAEAVIAEERCQRAACANPDDFNAKNAAIDATGRRLELVNAFIKSEGSNG